jgi:hypothetical protein
MGDCRSPGSLPGSAYVHEHVATSAPPAIIAGPNGPITPDGPKYADNAGNADNADKKQNPTPPVLSHAPATGSRLPVLSDTATARLQ